MELTRVALDAVLDWARRSGQERRQSNYRVAHGTLSSTSTAQQVFQTFSRAGDA